MDEGVILGLLKKNSGGGMPDPSAFADGTALVSVDGAWVQQEGYGYESAASVHQFDPKYIPNVAPPVEIGKFLALWDCSTGLPETDPADGVPYTYTTGDFYIISAVDSTANYMPNGTSYDGTASSTVDSGSPKINDMYFYDGALWRRLKNSEPTLSTETWTFTLEDKTTVTKKVVVSS